MLPPSLGRRIAYQRAMLNAVGRHLTLDLILARKNIDARLASGDGRPVYIVCLLRFFVRFYLLIPSNTKKV